jgi:hypothetical protein
MALLYGSFSERDLGTATGILCAVSVAGTASLPPLIGARAQRTSVQQALHIPVVVAMALAAVALSLGLLRPFLTQP